jgi:hypothetical protein
MLRELRCFELESFMTSYIALMNNSNRLLRLKDNIFTPRASLANPVYLLWCKNICIDCILDFECNAHSFLLLFLL